MSTVFRQISSFSHLSLSLLWQHDSSLGLGFSGDSLDQNAVVEWLEGLENVAL